MNAPIWRDVAERLERTRKNWSEVNLSRLSRYAAKGDQIVVPGVVLATGEIKTALTVAAFRTSSAAQKKIEAAGGRAITLLELAVQNPKGSGIRIMVTMPTIDATGHVVGRLASVLAKRLLNGEEIVVVNAEKAIVTGKRSVVFQEYRARHQRGSTASRMRGIGPAYPRRPDLILRRTISRMMPYQQPRGRDALKRLRVYLAVPDAFKDKPLEIVEDAKRPPQGPFMSLGEIAKLLGSKFEVSR